MDELSDLVNDLPAALNDGSDSTPAAQSTVATPPPQDDENEEDETPASNEATEEDEGAGDDEKTEGEEESTEEETPADENDQSEYVVDGTTEEDVDEKPPAATDNKPQTQDEFVLAGLQKMSVRVIGPDDKIYTVQAYGNGDLPRDMKGFATKYEEKVWDAAVIEQNAKARDLISEYKQKQIQADTDAFVRRENMAIRDDLTDLIKEGIFPKFKGKPGSREFEDSDGGKEFDRVVKYMNEQNQRYSDAANRGRAYRHIGFREAFVMLNGPNSKAAEKAEDKARKVVAKKLKSGGGTDSGKRNVSTEPVSKLTDLTEEFAAFAGSTS